MSNTETDKFRQLSPLLLDLQARFLQIRTLAEPDNVDKEALLNIQLLSQHALMTLDYALFAANVLQTKMPLTSISAAAAAREVADNLDQLAKSYDVELGLDITPKMELIFANEAAVKGALYGLASSLMTVRQTTDKKLRIVIAAQETLPNIQRLGIYSPDIMIKPSAIKLARLLSGCARTIAPNEIHHSGLGLLVSDQLVQALGSKLMRFVHRGQKGVGFYVPMSAQLSFL